MPDANLVGISGVVISLAALAASYFLFSRTDLVKSSVIIIIVAAFGLGIGLLIPGEIGDRVQIFSFWAAVAQLGFWVGLWMLFKF